MCGWGGEWGGGWGGHMCTCVCVCVGGGYVHLCVCGGGGGGRRANPDLLKEVANAVCYVCVMY